jgi:hypothetical protein
VGEKTGDPSHGSDETQIEGGTRRTASTREPDATRYLLTYSLSNDAEDDIHDSLWIQSSTENHDGDDPANDSIGLAHAGYARNPQLGGFIGQYLSGELMSGYAPIQH